jgi:NitT/TauT family transport system permease protein
MGAGRFQLTSKIILRGAAPHLMTGFRTALPQAVIGAVVGEFISSQHGIGFLIADASSRYNTAGVFAAILTLSVLVLVMAAALQATSAIGARRSG